MRSQIDWNEIVPRLAIGLQQTLYLEAVKLITEGAPRVYKTSQAARDYARRYARRKRAGLKTRKFRKWTPEQKKEVMAFYKEKGHAATKEKYRITSGMLTTWRRKLGVASKRANGAA